jgi:glycosyltransferase involved in cell wall biosynthesis
LFNSLHYLYSFDNRLGGGIHAPLSICKYLTDADQPNEIIAPFAPGDDISPLNSTYAKLKSHRFPKSGPRNAWYSRAINPWLKSNLHRFQIAEVHCVWSLSALQTARRCIAAGVPYLVRPHGALDPFDVTKNSLIKRLLGPLLIRRFLSNSIGVVCTASMEAERLITYGAEPNRFVVPLPVVLPDQMGDRSRFRTKHGISEDAPVVLFLSRIDYKKGLDFLVPALGRLKDEFPGLRFVLAGTGTVEYSRLVQQWIDEAGLRSHTIEVGFVTGLDKQDAFAAADVFALPSLNENFGMVNVEAMHAGLPLVISNQVYIHQEIEAGGAGLVCETNVESVTEILRKALSSPGQLKQMGQAGTRLVQRLYRPSVATENLVELYERLIGNKLATLNGNGER